MSEYLLTNEVAERYRKEPKTIVRWIKKGLMTKNEKGEIICKRLFAQKVGRNFLINPDTLKKFLYDIGQGAL